MKKEEEAVVKAGIMCGLTSVPLVKCVTEKSIFYPKNLKYWRRLMNKYNKELNKCVSFILNNKEDLIK